MSNGMRSVIVSIAEIVSSMSPSTTVYFACVALNPAGDQRRCSAPPETPFDGARSKLRRIKIDSKQEFLKMSSRITPGSTGCRCVVPGTRSHSVDCGQDILGRMAPRTK
jgi:hypothetical protein